MNKNLLIVFGLFMLQPFVAQTTKVNGTITQVIAPDNILDNESKVYYDLGNTAFAKKEYDMADSLFTVSLKILPHPDTYYNRAVCRRRMNDFSGYCVDLASAANMRDKESYRLYCKECAKIDTVYTKGANEIGTPKDFDFATFTTSYKYNTNGEYEKYDRNGALLLSYIIMGSDTIYLKSSEVTAASYVGGNDAIVEFIKTKSSFYNHVSKNKKLGHIDLSLTVGTNGKIRRVKVLLGLRDGSSDSLAKALYKLEPFESAKYNGKNVKYQSHITVDFRGSSLAVYDKKAFNKVHSIINALPDSLKETYKAVEVMPEFPGGAMEMMKFIQSNIKMPQSAKERGVSGKCYLRFVIGADGDVYDVEVLKGVYKCPECDAEAVRVVQLMPKWRPGMQNGKAVNVFFNLPINFQTK